MKIINVVNSINRGGFGIIERVLCDDHKFYARKTFSPLPNENLTDELLEKFRQRFIREVKTQMNLPHDLFIPIYYAELDGTNPWFLMPVADSVYTNEIIACKKERRVPNGLGDILNSMEFLHASGLVHRDLKPHNILLHEGRWKLSDFGLISQSKEILSLSITSTNDKLRTELYCSPEQLTDFKRVTNKADIYSFGAILHDIFSDESRVPYSELSAKGEIGLIIEKCTKKDPEHRFNNIKSLRDKLLSVLSKEHQFSLNQNEQEISQFLKTIDFWAPEDFEKFLFFLKRLDYVNSPIFLEFNEEVLGSFIAFNLSLFYDVSIMYAQWVRTNGFQYDYCDVIVNHLEFIYNNAEDNEVRALVAMAAARLGRRHNRWYVMHRVINMCDVSIPQPLAFRISLEIDIDSDSVSDFVVCAKVIGNSVNVYHPVISAVLVRPSID